MKYTIRTISQLGMALKSLRASRGLTQEEVAQKVGLLQKQYRHWNQVLLKVQLRV